MELKFLLIQGLSKTFDFQIVFFLHEPINQFIGFAHREKTTHLCKIWTWGYNFGSLIDQCGDDKCSQNENFHMDVIFHVWVDVTLNTLGF